MIETVWQRLDHGGRLALPLATTIACTLLGCIVWPLPYLGSVAPPLALMAIYYWAVHRPDLLRPGMAFAIGLLHDVLQSYPLGLSALLFVATHQIVFRQRRYLVGHSFFMMWTGFILTVTAVMALQWFLIDLIRWQIIPVVPVLIQTFIAIAIFPLPCWLFIKLQRLMLNPEH